MTIKTNLYLALVHHPVVNRKQKTIGSALTTIDLHDIARACRTFGVRGFYVVTPFEDQTELANQVLAHWTQGVGGELNPARKEALERIRMATTLEAACQEIESERQQPVVTVVTSARDTEGCGNVPVPVRVLKERLEGNASHVLVFGTAWGLADEVIQNCDLILEPIQGTGAYNHLSVRSAASIYLDRITNG